MLNFLNEYLTYLRIYTPDEVFLFSKTSGLYFQKSKHKKVRMPLLIKHVIFTQKVKSGLLLL